MTIKSSSRIMYLYFLTHGKVLRFYELSFFFYVFDFNVKPFLWCFVKNKRKKQKTFLNFDEKIYILYIISNGNDG